ncbi:unnamed protein product [Aspergillus oryzae]|uniref:Unnamed protein product n=2 Tax=Aspergillus oryzae TaxID=5062 RepID=A0AAN5BW69_ASPOZ|nr:unnamed protein product [Aspergillus oryzae]GMF89978.1 unnamed protein product [Aspergillus oryzae]GMG10853.1 unnamed protein product [Aspergillus oryzae]GMG27521.1 unnamed protein product [Aspergillus oryzae]GMG54211.1 unnamed protein product [Aspergillus oryzae var. brunneus]
MQPMGWNDMRVPRSRISDTILKNPGVPEYAKTRDETAVIPSLKLGLLAILKSDTHTPSFGAEAGRSSIPTAMVTIRTDQVRQEPRNSKGRECLLAVRMHTSPTHASQVIWPRVRMLENMNPRIAATATKTAVHTPCVETAFRPMERPSIPEPDTKIQSNTLSASGFHYTWAASYTQAEGGPQKFTANTTKDERTNVVDAIDGTMTKFENTDHVIRPGRDHGNSNEADDAWDNP